MRTSARRSLTEITNETVDTLEHEELKSLNMYLEEQFRQARGETAGEAIDGLIQWLSLNGHDDAAIHVTAARDSGKLNSLRSKAIHLDR